jgi:putative heme transporter
MSGLVRIMSTNDSQADRQAEEPRRRAEPADVPASLAWKIAAIISITLVIGLLIVDLLGLLIRPLGVLFAAVVVALTLAPIVDFLERWVPRLVAVLAVYAGLFLVVVGFALIIVPPVGTQIFSIVQNFPEHYRDFQFWMAIELGIDVGDDMEQLASVAGSAADYLFMLPAMIIGTGAELVVGFFVSLYWLHSMPRMKTFGLSLFPPAKQKSVERVMQRVGERMGGYMRGVVITGVAVGTAVFIGLTILGVKYALLLALLAFLGEFFPNVGPILAGIPAVTIAFLESPGLAVIVLVFYVVIQQLESYVLVPLIMMRTQAHIPPLVTTFAVFTGFMVGGVLWAILAIPLSGAILTFSTDVIAPAIRRQTGARDPDEDIVPSWPIPGEERETAKAVEPQPAGDRAT